MAPKSLLKILVPAAMVSTMAVGFGAPQTVVRAAADFWGSQYRLLQAPPAPTKQGGKPTGSAADQVRHWNETAVNASGLDHTPVAPGENRVFGEQVGPVRAARAMAIVHIAVFEAVNCIS